MSMIKTGKLTKFIVGFPTMINDNDVIGGVFNGDSSVPFGTIVTSTVPGQYVPAGAGTTKFVGVLAGTNVKLPEMPSELVRVNKGEGCNCQVKGCIALELDAAVATSAVLPETALNFKQSTGKLTTEAVAEGIVATNKFYLTGEYEKVGNTIIAEVEIR